MFSMSRPLRFPSSSTHGLYSPVSGLNVNNVIVLVNGTLNPSSELEDTKAKEKSPFNPIVLMDRVS